MGTGKEARERELHLLVMCVGVKARAASWGLVLKRR